MINEDKNKALSDKIFMSLAAVFIASLIPFGPFVIDKRLKQVSV